MTPANLARLIDHTLLKPDARPGQIETLCNEALEYGFGTVCINPVHVPQAAELLAGSTVKICTVAGFPLGACTTETKVFEAGNAIRNGAAEIDMVLDIGALKNNDLARVEDDIRSVAEACHAGKAILKVIFENCLLTDNEKRNACRICKSAAADFVKTSTGFSTGGAAEEDIRLMADEVAPQLGIKAAGGIRSLADAMKMIKAGATRIGTSAGVTIIEEALQ